VSAARAVNNSCRTCLWFRPFRPLSQLLIRELGAGDPQVTGELLKVMQDERARQDAEAQQKVELHRLEAAEWPIRPTMSDYCGFQEQEDVYLIHEVKNPDGKCGHYEEDDQVQRTCGTCRHREDGGGPARDEAQLALREQLAANSAALGQGGGLSQLEEYKGMVSSIKALEAAQAYYAGRLVHKRPDYLPTCALKNTKTEFVPCCVQNPHETCRDWQTRMSLTQALGLIGQGSHGTRP
jgi:hypothetical protein